MAQLAVVYRFRVRPKRVSNAQWRLLGDIDESGTRFLDVLPKALGFVDRRITVVGHEEPQPRTTFARHMTTAANNTVGAVMNYFEYGSRGSLHRVQEGDMVPFTEIDRQQVEVGLVAQAPPLQQSGFMCFQVPHRRGIKSDVHHDLHNWLGQQFNLHLEMEATAPIDAIETAISEHGVGPVAFRKLENPGGIFANASDWWQDGDDVAVVENKIKPARNRRLLGSKIIRFMRTHANALLDGEEGIGFPELATFDGREYDELSAEVLLHGRKKTMTIRQEGPAMRNAFSWDLDLAQGYDDADLAAELTELIPPG